MKTLLCANNISKAFGDNRVFESVNLELHSGETLALIGPSGIGKTTLLNILSGLMLPDTGNVTLEGKDITGKPGSISYMQQNDLLLPYYTVLENVSLPLIIKGIKKKDAQEKSSALFSAFGLDGYQNMYPSALSGGMRQRAALMRTYVQSHSAVLLDEPFGALDAVTRRKMQEWYSGISKELSLSTIIITHDTDEALIMADRICVMNNSPSTITAEISLPDKPSDFELTDIYLEKKREILSLLR